MAVVTADVAAAECAAWAGDGAIGSGLVILRDQAQLAAIKAPLDHLDYAAVWIGAAAFDTGAGLEWRWDGGADGVPLETIGYCDGVTAVPSPTARLALVKRTLLGPQGQRMAQWCVGQPCQAYGKYEIEVQTLLDQDGDGLRDADESATSPTDFDSDDDGAGDGREIDVLGTDPMIADDFAVIAAGPNPTLAYCTDAAYLACERPEADPP